ARVGERARLDLPRVAASQRKHDGNRAASHRLEDDAVPGPQPGVSQRKPAEGILLEGIDSALEEDDLRALQGGGEMALEGLEVLAIATVVGQLHVERAALLAEREVLRSVHREGEHVRVA